MGWGFLGKLGKAALNIGTGGIGGSIIDAIGAGSSAASQASAQNRGARLQALMDQDQMRMAASRDNRESERDILKKLAQSAYLSSGGANFKPSTEYTYSFAPRAASKTQMDAAGLLEAELMKRLQAGPMKLSNYSKEMRPGFWERFGGILGAGASAYGASRRYPMDEKA
jgi:hypothetical protein